MFGIIIGIHVAVCILLIVIVLIQQGKGGGLIDSLSSAESIFGTKTNTFLVKSTSVFAVIFFITCLSLAFFSIQKSKSLIETSYKPKAARSMPQPSSLPVTSETKTAEKQNTVTENKQIPMPEAATNTSASGVSPAAVPTTATSLDVQKTKDIPAPVETKQ